MLTKRLRFRTKRLLVCPKQAQPDSVAMRVVFRIGFKRQPNQRHEARQEERVTTYAKNLKNHLRGTSPIGGFHLGLAGSATTLSGVFDRSRLKDALQ